MQVEPSLLTKLFLKLILGFALTCKAMAVSLPPVLAPHPDPNVNVVWQPLPGSQELAMDARADEILFTGSRGPGKTECQLMRFRRNVGKGFGSYWRGVIFDREYKDLDDVVAKSKRLFRKFNDGAVFLESNSSYKWVWPTGEELLFRVIKTEDDYWNYHGQEFPFIGWNELTKFPNPKLYDAMMSCNRSSYTPEKDSPKDKQGNLLFKERIPLEVFSTTNSYGPGHGWVKLRFIDVAPFGQIYRRYMTVFDPQTQQEVEVVKTQVTIFGSYKENKYLDKKYVANLHSEPDKNKRKAWLNGDWNVIAGGSFDDLWDVKVHIIPRFKIPLTWIVNRVFDWGSTQPFHVGWWAEANGDEATLEDGTKFCPASGSLILIKEWYGCTTLGMNEGIKMPSGEIAEGIIAIEIILMQDQWVAEQPWPGPADNQIRDVKESDVDTIEKKMSDKGVLWTSSDKSPGSRKIGFELFRERLANAVKREGKAIYFMEHCRESIALIPVLPRDKKRLDDVDTEAEDHPYDTARYRVLQGNNRLATKISISYPN